MELQQSPRDQDSGVAQVSREVSVEDISEPGTGSRARIGQEKP